MKINSGYFYFHESLKLSRIHLLSQVHLIVDTMSLDLMKGDLNDINSQGEIFPRDLWGDDVSLPKSKITAVLLSNRIINMIQTVCYGIAARSMWLKHERVYRCTVDSR